MKENMAVVSLDSGEGWAWYFLGARGEGHCLFIFSLNLQVSKMNGLRLTLDLHSNSVSFGTLEHDYNAFNVFIGQRAEFPILKEKSIQLQPGQELELVSC